MLGVAGDVSPRLVLVGVHVLHFRGSSHLDIQIAIQRLLPLDAVIHTSYFTHYFLDPRVTLAEKLQSVTFLVPSVTMALDVDSDVAPVMKLWTQAVGQNKFMAPLPNPDEEQMVNEARQLQQEHLEPGESVERQSQA